MLFDNKNYFKTKPWLEIVEKNVLKGLRGGSGRESHQQDQWSPLRKLLMLLFSLGDYFLKWNKGGDQWTLFAVGVCVCGRVDLTIDSIVPLVIRIFFSVVLGYTPHSHSSKPNQTKPNRARTVLPFIHLANLFHFILILTSLNYTDATLSLNCKIFLGTKSQLLSSE